jgi:hypothetical protein
MVTPTSVGAVNTIDDLKNVTLPPTFATILAQGYNTPGDGGGGEFRWDATSTTLADDGLVISPIGNPVQGRWKRTFDGAVDLAWFGVRSNQTYYPGASITAGSAILTGAFGAMSDGGALAPGMAVMVPNAGFAGTTPLYSTIVSVNSPTQLTLAGTAVSSASNQPVSIGSDATAKLQALIDRGLPSYIPLGNYWISTVFARSNTKLRLDGHLAGIVSTVNEPFITTPGTTPFPGAGSLAAGIGLTTPIPGAFTAGQWGAAATNNSWVAIRLQPGNRGTAAVNQFGFDYAKVTGAGVGLTLDRNIRWGYPVDGSFTWQVLLIDGIAEAAGVELAAGSTVIPIDNTAGTFAAGDLIRIENQAGNDTYWALSGTTAINGAEKAYFEYARVKSATTTAVTIEDNLAYRYKGYWLIKPFNTHDVTIRGGAIDQISLTYGSDLYVSDVTCQLLSFTNAYRYGAVLPRGKAGANSPTRVIGVTNSKYGDISAAIATGGNSSSDNGNFKFLGVQHLVITGLFSYNTSASINGMYPLFGDFYNAPYSCWSQNVIVSGGYLGEPSAGASDSCFISGTRDCRFTDINMDGGLRVTRSVNPIVNATAEHVNAEGLRWGSSITGKYNYMLYDDCADFVSVGAITSGPSIQNARCLYIRNGSTRGRFVNYVCTSDTPTDRPVYVNDASDIEFIGCSDRVAHTPLSFETTDNSKNIRQIACTWLGDITNSAATNGEIRFKGDVHLQNSAFDRDRLVLDNRYIWTDANGQLRISVSVPASDAAGNLIPFVRSGGGTPVNIITPNSMGQVFIDTVHARAYVSTSTLSSDWQVIPTFLAGSKTVLWPALAAGASSTTTITVTGAAVGDYVQATMAVDLQGLMMSAYVGAANIITIVLSNPTTAAASLPSGTLTARIIR